ncbi:MAG: MmgE/PrpD family protein [Alphaproteobacteria bacterium]
MAGEVTETHITADAAAFIESARFEDIPDEAVRIARRCILDGLGLMVAGSAEHSVRILAEEAVDQGGRPDALVLTRGDARAPAPMAARVLGTAGHAHDWDDTQVSRDPRHVYGLLTHPTIPPLAAALATAQRLGTGGRTVDGRAFVTAFVTGFEVECKISEWMLTDHYRKGFHSSATVGTFGSAAAAAKLLGFGGRPLLNALGMAASFAAGLRCNFGTMTKPLHVGRAAENGVTAALLAARGFEADPAAIDGPWGFMRVTAGGHYPEKLSQGFGKTWSIADPGVSIKPYPSGIVTHQSMDAMLKLVTNDDIKAADVERIDFFAGSNILDPIRYPVAKDHLQAKFSMAALLSMIVIARRAGRAEFTDSFVQSVEMQDMQRRVTCILDPAIEAQGMDRIRSRIELVTRSGKTFTQEADPRYRGGPDNPLTDAELEQKTAACVVGLMDDTARERLIAAAWGVVETKDAGTLARVIQTDGAP